MTGAATSIVRLVFPDQTNHHGTFFGGELMRLLDAIAFIAATRYLRLPLVTARSEQIDLDSPVTIGELVHLRAAVAETRRTSLVIEAEAAAEDSCTGHTRLCTRARFVLAPARQARAKSG